MCTEKLIHGREEIFGGRGGGDFVLEVRGFGRCDKGGYPCSFSVEELFVNGESRFPPPALSSATGTLSMGNLWSKPGGRRAVG